MHPARSSIFCFLIIGRAGCLCNCCDRLPGWSVSSILRSLLRGSERLHFWCLTSRSISIIYSISIFTVVIVARSFRWGWFGSVGSSLFAGRFAGSGWWSCIGRGRFPWSFRFSAFILAIIFPSPSPLANCRSSLRSACGRGSASARSLTSGRSCTCRSPRRIVLLEGSRPSPGRCRCVLCPRRLKFQASFPCFRGEPWRPFRT